SGRRLAIVTARGRDGVTAIKEDGRVASFSLERIGRVFAPKFSTNADRVDEAFDEVHRRRDELVLPEPRLRDAQADEEDAFKLISDLIDSYTPADNPEHHVTRNLIWSLQKEASAI